MTLNSVKAIEVKSLENFCDRLFGREEVRFAGIINRMGNLVAGGFKDGIRPYASHSRQQVMFMQLVLEIKMRKEFDDVLGGVKYMHSKRDKVNMLSIPKGEFVIVISLKEHSDISRVVDYVEECFSDENIELD